MNRELSFSEEKFFREEASQPGICEYFTKKDQPTAKKVYREQVEPVKELKMRKDVAVETIRETPKLSKDAATSPIHAFTFENVAVQTSLQTSDFQVTFLRYLNL